MVSSARFLTNLSKSKPVQLLLVVVSLSLVYLYYASVPKASFRNHSENVKPNLADAVLNAEKQQDQGKPVGKLDANIDVKIAEDRNVIKAVLPHKIDVMLLFSNAKHNYNLRDKFKTCVSSILHTSTINLAFHIVGDIDSQKIGKDIISENAVDIRVQYTIENHDSDVLAKRLHEIVKPMQEFFSYKPGAYYSDSIFFLSIAIHKVMPDHLSKVIMLDADLKFRTDIAELYKLFFQFSDSNVMGIARDQQPVYRHTFWQYRRDHPGTRVGEPPPRGLTGFNSGVLLLDLQRLRNSQLYNKLINKDEVKALVEKYAFKGHLGDQDFFTLVGMEHENLFYELPCSWNRQLCVWWKDKGYADVFDLYFSCKGKVNVYHGNCNTPIPD